MACSTRSAPTPGRASVALDKFLRAMLIQVLFSVRGERQLMAQVGNDLLYH